MQIWCACIFLICTVESKLVNCGVCKDVSWLEEFANYDVGGDLKGDFFNRNLRVHVVNVALLT